MAALSGVLAWRIPGIGGAWQAAVYGVAQSQIRLKRLSSSSSSRQMTYLLCVSVFQLVEWEIIIVIFLIIAIVWASEGEISQHR